MEWSNFNNNFNFNISTFFTENSNETQNITHNIETEIVNRTNDDPWFARTPQNTPISEGGGRTFGEHPVDPNKEFDSYRRARDEEKLLKEKRAEKEKWQNIRIMNYPYKAIVIEAANTEKINIEISEELTIEKTKILRILHWNPNVIVGKIANIENLIDEIKPDVISLNETRTNKTTESYIFRLAEKKYLPIIKSREDKKREGFSLKEALRHHLEGGVVLFFKDTLTVYPINIPNGFSKIESVGAEVKVGDSQISIFTWYNRPKNKDVNERFLSFM